MQQRRLLSIVLWVVVVLAVARPEVGLAGSISDGNAENSQALCDKRISLELALTANFCTEQTRDSILDKCYVVVHDAALSGRECSWQGCKSMSLVGQPAQLSDDHFVEYGIPTKRQNAPYVQLDDGVLPQSPFKRHYMTVRTALEARRKQCKRTGLPKDVESKLCEIGDATLKFNPYFACLKLHRWID